MDQKLTGDDVRITRAIVGALRGRDLTGFELWRWLGPIHGSTTQLTEAALYPTLYRLEEAGLIEGHWSEDERTRRKYRMTTTGRLQADAQGWNDVASRRRRGEAGVGGTLAEDGDWSWPPDQAGQAGAYPDVPEAPSDSPEAIAAAAYIRALDASLQLSAVYRADVREEIDDHLADSSARLQGQGIECADAMDQAIAYLGPADALASQINEAQSTDKRLDKGLSWASAVGMTSSLVGLALCWFLISFFLLIGPPLILGIAAGFGARLYAPSTAELHAQAFGLAGWVGAFVGARRSLPHLAHRSRRSERSLWRLWALTGAAPLTLAAVILPVGLDPLSAVVLLGIPAAWVLGTLRPARLYGPTITTRGGAIGVAIVVAALLLPGARTWGFDPAAGPAAASPFTGNVPVQVTWNGSQAAGTWRVTMDLSKSPGWHDPRVELWPAVRSGVGIGPDRKATAPSLTSYSGSVDLTTLPRSVTDWWATVSAIGPDGQRHAIDASVVYGYPVRGRSSVAGWLIGLVHR